jgi:Cof subfamily protein (haloacid dehalogenase superfamily)
MTTRMLASDLDGTLLGSDDEPSPRTLAALRAAEEAGWIVVLATGRPARFVDPAVASLGVHGIAVCNNGATVYDPVERRIVREVELTRAIALEVVDRLRGVEPDLIFAADWGLELAAEQAWIDTTPWPVPADTLIGPPEEFITGPIAKLLANHPTIPSDELAHRTRGLLHDLIEVTSSTGSGVIEMTARGVSKGSALARVAADLGIGPEAVVAFGDMPNDTEMLRWAGLGVAMGNAHPAVKAAADEVTATNDEDGVALVVERLLADHHGARPPVLGTCDHD